MTQLIIRNKLNFLVQAFSLNPKKLFLVDGIGALVSAACLFGILSFFNHEVGLPDKTLMLLIGIALSFAIYSIFCFFYIDKQWRIFVRIIAILNLMYGLLTVFYVVFYFKNISAIGSLYFTFEIIILFCLAYLELKTAAHKMGRNANDE